MSSPESGRGSNLEKWSHIASIVGVVAGLISLWFVYAALRHQTRVSMAANSQALVELTQATNLELAKDPNLTAVLQKGMTDYDNLSADEKARYKRLWIIYLNVLENAYYQHEEQLLDDRFYAGLRKRPEDCTSH